MEGQLTEILAALTFALSTAGGVLTPPATDTAGCAIRIAYAKNDAPSGTVVSQIYGRLPTAAERLPYPTPAEITSDGVFFFDVAIASAQPVTFASGTAIDVTIPFPLDPSLRYNLSIFNSKEPIGPVYARDGRSPLHFELPSFTTVPGKTLMAEIDGDPR